MQTSQNKIVAAFLLVSLFATLGLQAATRAELLRAKLDSADTNYVFVVLHRAAWREAPENSIPAIEAAIAMGGDMVEIDVAKTKDGVHVLSHDGRLNRVSDRAGVIADMTLEEVRAARLKEGQGGPNAKLTDLHVPTLREALEACRGKILVNIDKFNGDPKGITAIIKEIGVEKQVVLKGYGDYDYMKSRIGEPFKYIENRDFVYMPIVGSGTNEMQLAKTIAHFQGWDKSSYPPPAYEVCIPGDAPKALFDAFRASPNRPRIWINTLWDSLAHGHSECTQGHTPESVWGWCLEQGATLIQTDDPKACLKYLTEKGRHDLEAK